MNKKSAKQTKDQKLKSALRNNLKKRKQFARNLGAQEEESNEPSVQLRQREISPQKPE